MEKALVVTLLLQSLIGGYILIVMLLQDGLIGAKIKERKKKEKLALSRYHAKKELEKEIRRGLGAYDKIN